MANLGIFVVCIILIVNSMVPCLADRFLPRRPRLDPGRIVGGVPITIDEVPYQVSLQYYGYHMCGGSIISEHFILTAAHCTWDMQPHQLSVRMGSTRHMSGGIVLPIDMVINHPNFDAETVDYDYSLIKLGKMINFNQYIKPINLPEKNDIVKDGDDCLVSGWGDTKSSIESNLKLRAAVIPKVNHEECNRAYSNFGGITERMMCAGFTSGGHDACQGDSGGPLACGEKQVGIVSWGYGCAKPNYPGIYSDIATVRDWITDETGV